MPATANLALPHIAEGQGRPDIQHNDSLDALDAAMTERLVVDFAGADGAVTAAQARAHFVVYVTGATIAGLALALPAVRRPFFVVADPANRESFSAVRGPRPSPSRRAPASCCSPTAPRTGSRSCSPAPAAPA